MTFNVNPAAQPYLNHVGQEKTPVFILDNFMLNVENSLLNNIEQIAFDSAPTYYPGIRAKLPNEYMLAVAKAVVPLLYKIYSIPQGHKVEFFDSYYSLVTHAPDELSLEQQIPHFDGTDTYRFALLHYLNPSQHGGTSFYKHTPSGMERVYESNVDEYLNSVSNYFQQNGEPNGQYIDSSNEQFEKIGEIPYVQNRMAIYPGNLLHSGSILGPQDIDPNPKSGRLTANIFLHFKPS
ncbi:DUF6445 family protein [Glaciecola petra]|uniref:DUF6445 family protein n=1 Tax=Glaciecola petra TaxID=3075602 RepID=A0ABU2ZR07_9ALTE|nr:DUF6445 family protein [Aestuariibacter sp. P117]MDT0595047.1 DUF6445 family protein [Aestuariibacter sp. P117]